MSSLGNNRAEPSKSSDSHEDRHKNKRINSLHLPIEAHWHLPEFEKKKKFSLSKMSFRSVQESLKGIRRNDAFSNIFQAVRDPKDEHAVKSLRELLLSSGQLPEKYDDYHTLLRFLRMRNFDVTKAKQMFLNMVKWREEMAVDAIAKGANSFAKPARELFLEIQKIDSNYYPETLHKLYIINAGPGFRVLWKALNTFMEARTLSKIQVLGDKYQSKLLEVVDPSNLPEFLGGTCTCSDQGGCLLKDKGPWTNPEIGRILQEVFIKGQRFAEEPNSIVAVEESTKPQIVISLVF